MTRRWARRNAFTKGFYGSPGRVFKCSACGKRTRDTGGNASVGLCPDCYKEFSIENMISDGKEPQCTECLTTLALGDDSDWKCPKCGARFDGIDPRYSTWKKLKKERVKKNGY